MDGLLASLTPLATLLSRIADPSSACAMLALALGTSSTPAQTAEILRSRFGSDAVNASLALTAARVTAANADWRIRLAQAEVLALEIQRHRPMAPRLAMTVPDFLRQAWNEHLREIPAADWPRETWPAILDLASSANTALLLAAPFLSRDHARALAASVGRLTQGGGEILLITQSCDTEPTRASVALLRDAAHRRGRMHVWSWSGPGLGIHFKAVVADRHQAYVGSANLTTHAAILQAEAGVILRGPHAYQLDLWLRRIATHQAHHEGTT